MFLKRFKNKRAEKEIDDSLQLLLYIGLIILFGFAIYKIVGSILS